MSLANTSVIVRPVLDLAGHQPVDSYEIPDRIRRQVPSAITTASSRTAPNRPNAATSTTSSPTPTGGVTCPCNLAPLCRGHHRLKTADRASYRMLSPGTYHWTLPSGTYLVDPTGTHQLTGSTAPDPPEE